MFRRRNQMPHYSRADKPCAAGDEIFLRHLRFVAARLVSTGRSCRQCFWHALTYNDDLVDNKKMTIKALWCSSLWLPRRETILRNEPSTNGHSALMQASSNDARSQATSWSAMSTASN